MNKQELLDTLFVVAETFDNSGFTKGADIMDGIMKKVAQAAPAPAVAPPAPQAAPAAPGQDPNAMMQDPNAAAMPQADPNAAMQQDPNAVAQAPAADPNAAGQDPMAMMQQMMAPPQQGAAPQAPPVPLDPSEKDKLRDGIKAVQKSLGNLSKLTF